MTQRPIPATTDARPNTRRGFLRSLTTLPLIGGGITLIGQPTAAAVPVTFEVLDVYSTWLFYERRMVAIEMAKGDRTLADQLEHYVSCNSGDGYFFGDEQRFRSEPPSTRAAVVLSAVGCSWQEDQ